MASDPAVRHIQIASALVDRLGELLRPQRGAGVLTVLGGGDVVSDALELKLGEAQQISPEIWRHLDDARGLLAKRGVDLAGYDELRSLQSAALLATSNIDVQRKLDHFGLLHGSIRVITTKTVTWDAGNLTSAIAACALMKRVMPETDWEALDRADREHIASVGSLRAKRWKSIASGLGVAVVLAGATIGIRALVVRGDSPAAAEDKALAARKEASRQQYEAKLAELAAKYATTPCDKDLMRKYTAYLYAAGHEEKSHEIEDKFLAECPH